MSVGVNARTNNSQLIQSELRRNFRVSWVEYPVSAWVRFRRAKEIMCSYSLRLNVSDICYQLDQRIRIAPLII